MSSPRLKRFGKSIERFFARRRQALIMQFILSRCGGREVVRKYRDARPTDGEPLHADSPVWVFWWQGEEAMPTIVRACLNSIRQQAGTHPVRLLTEKNYSEYVTLPDYILARRACGELDLTHFSDILRMQLLREHGGIWCDATLLLPFTPLAKITPPEIRYWSCRHVTPYVNVARGGWVSFFVASGRGCPLTAAIADLHLAYWKRRGSLIDYLLLDYMFAIARRHIPAARDLVEATPPSQMGLLGKCLNDALYEKAWQTHLHEFAFHKLTYKIPLAEQTPAGEETYYGRILREYYPHS